MFDLTKEFGPGSWREIERQIRCGDDPPMDELASTIRASTTVPPRVVREYIADLLEGKIKRKRGRKRQPRPLSRIGILFRIEELHKEFAKTRGSDPLRSALGDASEEFGVPEDTLKTWYYEMKRKTNRGR